MEVDELEEEYALELGRELSSLFDENVLISIDHIVIEGNVAQAMQQNTRERVSYINKGHHIIGAWTYDFT